MIDLSVLAPDVANIAKEAGAYLRKSQTNFDRNLVELKSLNALVSNVDRSAEKLIVSALKLLIPEAGFLTEEGTTPQDTTKQYLWVIDPLDGTTNFVHGLPIFSVSIALLHHGEPVLGVVYEVGMDESFTAYKDGGAFLNGSPISVTSTKELKNTLLATGFPYYEFSKLQGFQNTLAHFYQHTRGVRRIGTAAVDLAYTACGRFDGYFEYGLSPWDVAAGIVLVREAGGIVTNFENINVAIASDSIIAANKSIHPLVYTTIKQHVR
ncbi:MAG: inositol monophosphatase [Flavobacteriales bacterium]|nr:inositol monophosphatase [Flavobacteriales bacterium]|tara:strand:+ start:7048 stop:7845 length:798 start_codon:yes stop_codon:yes gene_type:complete